MWSARREELSDRRVLKFAIELAASPVAYSDVVKQWQHDSDFRAFWVALLADAPFSAFRWETPSVTAETANRPFEFVLLDCPGLARQPDPDSFAEHFKTTKEEVVAFPNLGRDGIMVVPCPRSSPSNYGHLAAFVRGAPDSQKHALWTLVGKMMEHRIGSSPVWLSTAGAGVSWLHVRLDDRPKYYGYSPYRDHSVNSC